MTGQTVELATLICSGALSSATSRRLSVRSPHILSRSQSGAIDSPPFLDQTNGEGGDRIPKLVRTELIDVKTYRLVATAAAYRHQ
jgi:hypothetical protein